MVERFSPEYLGAMTAAAERSGKKLAKSTVDYGLGDPRGARCGVCRHFLARANGCEIVAGEIEASMWCNRFARKGAG